jgi:predicted RNase H-like HicB family nuclease
MKRTILPLMPFWAKLLGVDMYKVVIEWLDDEEMFVAYSNDIDGLIVEAETLNEMLESLQGLVPALLEANGQIKERDLNRKLDLNIRLTSPLSHLATSVARPA